MFTKDPFDSSTDQFRLTFDYLGLPVNVKYSGGFVGYSSDLNEADGWLAGALDMYSTIVELNDNGWQRRVPVDFSFS